MFVDILMDVPAHADAVAQDIRDILLGRFPDIAGRVIAVVDQSTGQPVPGWKVEFDDLEVSTPDVPLALQWRVVKLTAATYFPEAVY